MANAEANIMPVAEDFLKNRYPIKEIHPKSLETKRSNQSIKCNPIYRFKHHVTNERFSKGVST
jgi:hypothetical protein